MSTQSFTHRIASALRLTLCAMLLAGLLPAARPGAVVRAAESPTATPAAAATPLPTAALPTETAAPSPEAPTQPDSPATGEQ